MASPSTGTLKTIVLKAGECVVLPKDAVVKSIITEGSVDVIASCGTLPTPVAYKCGVFYQFVSVNPDDDGPLDEENTFYDSLRVGGNTYLLGDYVVIGDNPGIPTPVATLNMHLGTDIALFEFTSVQRTVLSDRQLVALYFKAPEDLFDDIELKISDRGTFYYLKPNDATCGEYPAP